METKKSTDLDVPWLIEPIAEPYLEILISKVEYFAKVQFKAYVSGTIFFGIYNLCLVIATTLSLKGRH